MEFELSSTDSINQYFRSNEFIYIIHSEYGCKIGISQNPLQRLDQIKQGLPSHNAMIIGLYRGNDCSRFEKRLHKLFKERKISGEWFILNQSQLEEINDFLIKNNFICFLRISITWANYLIPSIYLNGRIKVIEIEKKISSPSKTIFPEIIGEIIAVPNESEISKKECDFLNTNQISEILKAWDLNYAPVHLGKHLKVLGFKKRSIRIKGLGVRQVYAVKIKKRPKDERLNK